MDTLYQEQIESKLGHGVQDYMSEDSKNQIIPTDAQKNSSLACVVRICYSNAIQQNGCGKYEAVAKDDQRLALLLAVIPEDIGQDQHDFCDRK